ncbi:hypothetical protein [Aquimarina sp. 2201CG5-10]|uniref:hypothetical protein n=1 Tax=Aquimarina callyspongiae TaxID=3098150 RepID=UPI002AB3A209|nr:hypothetical protein [Aquimarina sp. 2201CG5-10]MDY8137853.1 hypothetical protein [Aquimarina sp. 2201CG5-10]
MMYTTQPLTDVYITSYQGVSLYNIGKQNLSEFSDFVFKQYAYHYFKKYSWYPSSGDHLNMRKSDEEQFKNSVYFGFRSSQQNLLGTIKATRKREGILFPIEYEFNIDIENVIKKVGLQVNEIWHLGRLAINSEEIRKQQLPITSREVLRYLLLHSFEVINQQPDSLIIAESDVLIYKIFRELGVNMQIIGDLKECLGSPTYPVIITDIGKWIKENTINKLEEVL